MTDHTALIERLERATAADRELDADLFIALVEPTWVTSPRAPGEVASDKRAFWPEGRIRFITRSSKPAPRLTASLDAAIALCERVLPGSIWHVAAPGHAWLHRSADERMTGTGEAATPAIALCLAILRALEQEPKP